MKDLKEAKETLTKIWGEAVNHVNGETAVQSALENNLIPKPDQILSIGKAAPSMMKAALAHYTSKQETFQGLINGLVITKYGHSDTLPQHIQLYECGHPLPDKNSLQAGKAALNLVTSMPKGAHLLLLISGGASSLAEVLNEDADLKDLIAINAELLKSGADIETINRKRKSLSKIKGGKLLSNFKGSTVHVLAISDVPNGNLEILGSGIGSGQLINNEQTNYHSLLVATNETARQKAEECAKQSGLKVIENSECLYEDITPLSETLSKRITKGPKGLYIWGGEPTVKLPKHPGQGGRNQALGLLLAKHLKGEDHIAVLVAGTDGTDGPTNAAGALIDGKTFKNDPTAKDAIKNANATPFLKSQNALFTTGPTGTNVMATFSPWVNNSALGECASRSSIKGVLAL